MKRVQIIACVLVLSFILATAIERSWSFEVTDMVFTTEIPDCQRPSAKSSFTDLDLGITAWVYYVDYEDGKTWKLEWYSPNSTLAHTVSNSRGSTAGGCSWRCISRETLMQFGNGQWTVKFYYDGVLYKTANFNYAVTQQNIWKSNKIYSIPDYYQTDPSYGGFAEGGSNYCAPVSVSNSLMWLANNGFDKLASNTKDRKKDQYDLISTLGLKYMSTDPYEGTNVRDVLTGVKNYLTDKGYRNFQLKYQGWRETIPEASTGVELPDMAWIKKGIEGTGSVWLNLGWYTYDSAKEEYNRVGGHWVTLVGYGYGGNSDYLVVHDPNTCYTNHYVLPVRITNGNLTGNNPGLPRSAVGFYKMNNGMRISSKADYGILDGVAVLTMGSVSSMNVGHLEKNLRMSVPCVEYHDSQYEFELVYSPTLTDLALWEIDLASFREVQNGTEACLAVGDDLTFNLSAEYDGAEYSFEMDYAPDPFEPLRWRLDVNTLKPL